ncbi:hypothetical protein ACMA5I_07600 [Paracoccaceae bacterium GXU_MW_L88]
MPMKELPIILSEGTRAIALEGAANAASLGLAPVLSAPSRATDLMRHSDRALLAWLHRKLAVAGGARDREGWLGGRLLNRATGENPAYIPLSGLHLAQVLAVLDLALPEGLAKRDRFLLRADLADRACQRLRAAEGLPPHRFSKRDWRTARRD